MNFVKAVLLAFLISTVQTRAADAVYVLKDLTTLPIVRKAVLTPIGPPVVVGNNIIVNFPRTFTNLVEGEFTVYEIAPRAYRVELFGPSVSAAPSVFTNVFPSTITGTVYAKDYISPILPITGTYSQSQADALFVRRLYGGSFGLNSTNLTNYGTLKIPGSAGNGKVLTSDASGNAAWATPAASGVSSVAISAPSEFSVSGSPITTSGTLALTKAIQAANAAWLGPVSGSAAAPAFRLLVENDFPYMALASNALRSALTITSNQLTTASNDLRAAITTTSNQLTTASNYFEIWNGTLQAAVDTSQPAITAADGEILHMSGSSVVGSPEMRLSGATLILGSTYAPGITTDANAVDINIFTPYAESYHGGNIVLSPANADEGFNRGAVIVNGPVRIKEPGATNEPTTVNYVLEALAGLGSVVNSVNGDSGVVLLTTSDIPEGSNLYWQSSFTNGLAPIALVTTASNALQTSISGKANTSHAHAGEDITSGTVAAARIASLDAAKITSGTFDVARVPDLAASKITSGTLATGRIAGGTASSSFVPTSDGAGNVTWLAQAGGSGPLFYATNTTTITNATTEFSFLQTGTGTLTIPANTFTPGKTVRVFVAGTYYTGANGSTTWRAKLGGTTLTSAAVTIGANRVSKSFEYEFYITCYTTGASGTVGITGSAQADSIFIPVNQFLPITVDTTGSLAIDATTQFAAATGNSIRAMTAFITYQN